MKLKDKAVLITGAGSGPGREAAFVLMVGRVLSPNGGCVI
jgi:NAD(P)-dependent dehydrogenase (short-subunit alcohol dehydrogenase family)